MSTRSPRLLFLLAVGCAAGPAHAQPLVPAEPTSRQAALDALLALEKSHGKLVYFGKDKSAVEELRLNLRAADENAFKALKWFPELEKFQTLNAIPDGWLAYLKPLKNLKSLGLNNTPVGDAGLKHLEGLTGLEELQLVGTKVTDAGMKSLAKLKGLRALVIMRTAVGDAGLKHLEALPGLRVLSVGRSKVTAKGAAAFRKARPDCNLVGAPE